MEYETKFGTFNWIINIINSCENEYHINVAKKLIKRFETHCKDINLSIMLQAVKTSKELEILNNRLQ